MRGKSKTMYVLSISLTECCVFCAPRKSNPSEAVFQLRDRPKGADLLHLSLKIVPGHGGFVPDLGAVIIYGTQGITQEAGDFNAVRDPETEQRKNPQLRIEELTRLGDNRLAG